MAFSFLRRQPLYRKCKMVRNVRAMRRLAMRRTEQGKYSITHFPNIGHTMKEVRMAPKAIKRHNGALFMWTPLRDPSRYAMNRVYKQLNR